MPARLADTLLLHDSQISAFHAAIFNLVWVVFTNAIDSALPCRTPACRNVTVACGVATVVTS